MKRFIERLFVMVLLLALSAGAAMAAALPDAQEIVKTIDNNLYPSSYQLFMQVVNKRPNAHHESSVIYSAKHSDGKTILLIITPEHLRGWAAMRADDVLWMRHPGDVDPYKESINRSIIGGVFENSDLMPVEFHKEYTATLLEENESEYLLELHPSGHKGGFLRMRVEKRLMLPRVVEYYAENGTMLKRVSYTKIKKFGRFPPRPSVLEAVNSNNRGYVSTLTIGRMEERQFADEVFSVEALSRVGQLLR